LKFRGTFSSTQHSRRLLEALLAIGIAGEKVGDILAVGEAGAQAIVVPELVDYLSLNLKQVRSVPVKVSSIPLSQLKVQPLRVKSITSVEASLRLDAVASAGFGISRSKNGGRDPAGRSTSQLEASYPSQLPP
jgi:RNA-binding protein YlmH